MNNRELILESAIKIFLEYGFNGASVSKIIKESGLSNGTVFHYFKNKDELINSAYYYAKVTIAEYLKDNMSISQSHKASLFSYWKCYIRWALDNRNLVKFYMNFTDSQNINPSTAEDAARHFDFIENIFTNAIDEGVIINDDVTYLMIYTLGAANSTITYLLLFPNKIGDEFIESSFKMYWRSVVNI